MKKLITLTLGILLAFIVYSTGSKTALGATDRGPAVGMTIESFKTKDLEGNDVDSSLFEKAKLTVINYWATWCPPCRMEMPDLAKLHKHYSEMADADIQLIGVISEGNGCTPDSARQYLSENGFDWLNIRSTDELDKAFYTSNSIPQTLVVNGEGTVLFHKIGAFMSYDQLTASIEPLLNSAASVQTNEPSDSKPNALSCSHF